MRFKDVFPSYVVQNVTHNFQHEVLELFFHDVLESERPTWAQISKPVHPLEKKRLLDALKRKADVETREQVEAAHPQMKKKDFKYLFSVDREGLAALENGDYYEKKVGQRAVACAALEEMPNYLYAQLRAVGRLDLLRCRIIPSISYAGILKSVGIRTVDYLQLDCEGADFNILRGRKRKMTTMAPGTVEVN